VADHLDEAERALSRVDGGDLWNAVYHLLAHLRSSPPPALLPTDPEDERIVGELVARRTGATRKMVAATPAGVADESATPDLETECDPAPPFSALERIWNAADDPDDFHPHRSAMEALWLDGYEAARRTWQPQTDPPAIQRVEGMVSDGVEVPHPVRSSSSSEDNPAARGEGGEDEEEWLCPCGDDGCLGCMTGIEKARAEGYEAAARFVESLMIGTIPGRTTELIASLLRKNKGYEARKAEESGGKGEATAIATNRLLGQVALEAARVVYFDDGDRCVECGLAGCGALRDALKGAFGDEPWQIIDGRGNLNTEEWIQRMAKRAGGGAKNQ
jgi:hypothetical protein